KHLAMQITDLHDRDFLMRKKFIRLERFVMDFEPMRIAINNHSRNQDCQDEEKSCQQELVVHLRIPPYASLSNKRVPAAKVAEFDHRIKRKSLINPHKNAFFDVLKNSSLKLE